MSPVKRGVWCAIFFLGLFNIFTSEFTEQLTYPEVFIHLAILCAVYFGFMFPPEELVDGVGVSLFSIFSALFVPENYGFLEYCWLRQAFFHICWNLFPAVFACYFFHGQLFMSDQKVSRFPFYFDFPAAWTGCILFSVTCILLDQTRTAKYDKLQFLKFFYDNPECKQEVEEMIADPDTFKVKFANNAKLYCNANYFVYVSNFRFVAVRQADVRLQVDNARMPLIPRNDDEERLRHIFVKVAFRRQSGGFTLSLRHDYFRHLNQILQVPIHVPPHITIPLTIMEELKEDCIERIGQNDRLGLRMKADEREPCFACGTDENIITIAKTCADNNERWQYSTNGQRVYTDQCEMCRCRPLWCDRCIAQIFISKQNIDDHFRHDYWRGTAKCPTCRKVFCIRDVHLVDFDIETEEGEEAQHQAAPVEN